MSNSLDVNSMEQHKRKAMVFGSTGLIGTELVKLLVASPHYDQIITVARQDQSAAHWNLQTDDQVQKWKHVRLPDVEVPLNRGVPSSFDPRSIQTCGEQWLDALDTLPWDGIEDVYISIGTTRRKAGSAIGFWHVDVDLKVAIAKVAKSKGVQRLMCVSSVGASANAFNFYLRAKGMMEQAIIVSEVPQIHIVRPTLLLGDRKEHRPGERFAIRVSTLFPWLYAGPFQKYKPIEARQVARFMLHVATNWPQPPKPDGYDQNPSAVFFHEAAEMQLLS